MAPTLSNQVLTFETCTCAKCQESLHPVGRMFTAKGEIYSTFCSAKDGIDDAKLFRSLGIITEENEQELIEAIETSRVFPIIPSHPFRGMVAGDAKTEYLKRLHEFCDRETELVVARMTT